MNMQSPTIMPSPNAPEPLKLLKQWVLWRLIHKEGQPKPTKVPIDPHTGNLASVSDPATWGDFETVCYLYMTGGYSGIGFVLTQNDPFVFIDLDDCRDPKNGNWKTHAQCICFLLPEASWETSQSGNGLHGIVHVNHKAGLSRKSRKWQDDAGNRYECYTEGRFIAFGHSNWSRPDLPIVNVDTVAAFVPDAASKTHEVIVWNDRAEPDYCGPTDDDELIQRAMQSKGGPGVMFGAAASFAALWNGDEAELGKCYPDTSAQRPFDNSSAEIALANCLAWWTGRNPARIERIMNRAPLCQRVKWFTRADYRKRTIEGALNNCKNYMRGDNRHRQQNEKSKKIGDYIGFPNALENIKKSGFHFTRADQLKNESQEWIVNKIIPKHSLCLLFGASGSGKTFAALSIGTSLASGFSWYGHQVQTGAVLYICGEGKSGISKRLNAYAIHSGQPINGIPFYVSSSATDFSDSNSLSQIKAAIEQLGIKPILIIIDTLSRNISADENDSQEMALLIKVLDSLKDDYGASILLVHHTGHAEKSRARGSSVLKAAMDAEFKFEKEGNSITFECTKMKDAEEPAPKQFELKRIPIPGDDLFEMGAVLIETKTSTSWNQNMPSLSPQNRKALSVLQQHPGGISKQDFCQHLVRENIMDCEPKNEPRIFKRIVAALKKEGMLSEDANSVVWTGQTSLGQRQDKGDNKPDKAQLM